MAVRFQTGEPVTLIFPFGDFREFQGQHGLQYLYTVQLNGDPREKLYATPTLHRELQAAGVGAGTLFTITKLSGEGGQYWRVENGAPTNSGNGHAHHAPPPDASALPPERRDHVQPPIAPPAPRPGSVIPAKAGIQTGVDSARNLPSPNGSPAANGADGFTQLEHLLGHCLAASSRVCGHLNGQVQFTSEDIRNLGVTLFLECNRKQVLPEPLQR